MKHFEATKINEGSSGSTVSSRVLTEEDLTRIKTYRKQKDLHRVYKAAESRKHLANIRVVQKNLIFVVGLSQRLANESVLMGEKFLGQFGHIHKVAINHSTLYAGTMGPSASAYVTYVDSVSALRAIKCLNKVFIDDREIKASLGTTKYCSSYLRWVKCSKKDCMYLHDIADIEASFTKEEMQMGKHTDYEKYLINLNEKGFLGEKNKHSFGKISDTFLSTIQKNAHSFDSERFTYSRKKSIGSDTNSNNSSSISNYTDHINISFSRSENGVPLVSIKDCLYGTVSLSTIVNYIKNEYPYYDRKMNS